ncbi:hypothetical protein [Paenibacillus humicus]|uniref:hypothetical protein n=1 Tax=Paenibacillus humicus TaxID=412861 RepID=UPI0013E2E741|nr:hypothetical protein [Paenibacillus humicus]
MINMADTGNEWQLGKRAISKVGIVSLILSSVAFCLGVISLIIVISHAQPQPAMSEIEEQVNVLAFQHAVEKAAVTDDFIVNRVLMNSNLSYIDISLQPSVALAYKGQGKFDLQAEELKDKIIAIMDVIKPVYGNYNLDGDWDARTYKVTIQNYVIGTYKNGTVNLE